MGKDAPDGFKNTTVEARVSKWVDPDDDTKDNGQEFTKLLSEEF